MFKIEKNVNIDDSYDGGSRISWPWRYMEVGDSVFFGPDLADKAQIRCHVHGKQAGMKFKSRKVDGGIRVWRVE